MNPKPQIHTGTDSFAELLSENNVFVDKSMFIQEFLEESGGKVALITLPRRWGKTLNMDMLRRFLSLEVDELLKKVPTPTPAEKIQQWYNGYTFRSEVLYNPWSIMCCLESKGELAPYWLDSGGTQLIDAVLLSDEIQQDIQTLLSGGSIDSPIMKQISFEAIREPVCLFSLLLFSDYLNPAMFHAEKDIYRLSIPNYEVEHIL